MFLVILQVGNGNKMSKLTTKSGRSKEFGGIIKISFELTFFVSPSLFSRVKDSIRVIVRTVRIFLCCFLRLFFCELGFKGTFFSWRGNRRRFVLLRFFL